MLDCNYASTPVHNEITTCFSYGAGMTTIHCSYWYNDTSHVIPVTVPFDWAAASHNYGVVGHPATQRGWWTARWCM